MSQRSRKWARDLLLPACWVSRAGALAAAALCFFLATSGVACAGRSELRAGRELSRRGDYRQAYLKYWEAYSASPTAERRSALLAAGRQVAAVELARGHAAEALGELPGALDHYALALEYAPLDVEVREAHARAWSVLCSASGWTSAGLRPGPAECSPWARVERILDTVGEQLTPAPGVDELRLALKEALDRAPGALGAADPEQELPGEAALLEALDLAWRSALADLERLSDREEDLAFSLEADARALGGAGLVRGAWLELEGVAAATLARIAAARGALELQAAALASEKAGDLRSAALGYTRAHLLHPGLEGALEGRCRTLAKLASLTFQSALLQARDRDWRGALDRVSTVLELEPADPRALELRSTLEQKLTGERLREARRYEDAGLLGCALVRYYLALEAFPGDASTLLALRRAEAALTRRLRPFLRLELEACEGNCELGAAERWDVPEARVRELREGVLGAARRQVQILCPGEKQPGEAPDPTGERLLLIEDLDFRFVEQGIPNGSEVARYFSAFHFQPNPRRASLDAEVLRLEVSRQAREAAAAAASPEKRLLAGLLAEASSQEILQARALLVGLRPIQAELSWAEASVVSHELSTRAELRARVRIGSLDRQVQVELESRDRVVEGNPRRGVAPDPSEGLSRLEALRLLGPRLGEKIARAALEEFRVAEEKHYREGLARLEANAFDLGVESLVHFLYSRRSAPDPLVEDAARRVAHLTGCDLLAHWRTRSSTPSR